MLHSLSRCSTLCLDAPFAVLMIQQRVTQLHFVAAPLASFCCFTEWFCLATFVIVLINWTSCYIATLIVFAPPLWLLPHHPTLPPSPCLSLLSYDICRPAALLKLLSSCSTSCLLHCLCTPQIVMMFHLLSCWKQSCFSAQPLDSTKPIYYQPSLSHT